VSFHRFAAVVMIVTAFGWMSMAVWYDVHSDVALASKSAAFSAMYLLLAMRFERWERDK
jgi:hypothetical protein